MRYINKILGKNKKKGKEPVEENTEPTLELLPKEEDFAFTQVTNSDWSNVPLRLNQAIDRSEEISSELF